VTRQPRTSGDHGHWARFVKRGLPPSKKEWTNGAKGSLQSRLGLEHHMIAAVHRDEPGCGNQRGETSAFFERPASITASMEHERRHPYCLSMVCHVQLMQGLKDRRGLLRRGRDLLEIIEPPLLLLRSVRNAHGREDLSERRIVAPPHPMRMSFSRICASSRCCAVPSPHRAPLAQAPSKTRCDSRCGWRAA
jgi:hypothetical protein